MKYSICIDVGSDSVKVAYATENEKGKSYHSLRGDVNNNSPLFASEVYFDEESKTWVFGQSIHSVRKDNYNTVVEITDLLRMTMRHDDKDVFEYNCKQFYKGNEFPIFYFVNTPKKILNDPFNFKTRSEQGGTFVAEKTTPYGVCRDFFAYLFHEIRNQITMDDTQDISLVCLYHHGYGHEYRECLRNLMKDASPALGVSSLRIECVNATQAISYYVKEQNKLQKDKSYLFFDMGENYLSVAKAKVDSAGAIVTDHFLLHNSPLDLGGADIDKELEKRIRSRSAHSSLGEDKGSSSEKSCEQIKYSNEYLLMQNIKAAKELLSIEKSREKIGDAAPVCYYLDTCVQTSICLNDVEEAWENKIKKKTLEYVLTELSRSESQGVTGVFFSGGASCTSGFIDAIKRGIKKNHPAVSVVNLAEDRVEKMNVGVFAACLGGCIIGVDHIDIATTSAFTYGTYTTFRDERDLCFTKKCNNISGSRVRELKGFSPIVFKGQVLTKNNLEFPQGAGYRYFFSKFGGAYDEFLYQVNLDNYTLSNLDKNSELRLVYVLDKGFQRLCVSNEIRFHCTDDNQSVSQKSPYQLAVENAGLKEIVKGKIALYYKKQRIKSFDFGGNKLFSFEETLVFDEETYEAYPKYKNRSDWLSKGTIEMWDKSTKTVPLHEIEIVLFNGGTAIPDTLSEDTVKTNNSVHIEATD